MKSWIKLLLCVLAVWAFVYMMPKAMLQVEAYQKLQRSSALRGIDNNTLFYSEEPLSYQAEQHIVEKIKAQK